MAICAVCYENCRGKCGQCGARLCYLHKPKSKRAKCEICKTKPIGTYVQKVPLPPQISPQIVSTAYYTPPQKRFEDMDKDEVLQFIRELQDWLTKKKQREREYLDRRAASPWHKQTKTDYDYEADQPQEEKLLQLLQFWYDEAKK